MEPEQVAELFASCERFEALADGDVAPLVKENMHFHSTIVDAAASGRVAELVRKVIELPLVYRSYIWYSPEQRRISAHFHRQIAVAIEARDADRAESLMKEHVFEARDLLVAARSRPGARRVTETMAKTEVARDTSGPGPLAGVRVIELGMLLAGPFTGRLLGDLGAEIIKVEPPGQPDPLA